MQTILYNISQVIGVAIIHSLWQGLLAYLGLRLIILLFPNLSSASKHNLALTALLTLTGWFTYTLVNEINVHTWVSITTHNEGILPAAFAMPLHVTHNVSYNSMYNYTIEGMLPYITLLYIIGLIFNTAQLVWARKKISNIRQTMSIDVQLQLKVDQFVSMLNITDKVRFGLSKLVDAPCMMGYFKPVILLPFTLSSYLSAEEIEIIILHELAHIKRNDYLINLAQQAMSVLLFFNPFAQLIDRTINKERENSCDDIVIEATQKPLVYAHALLKLEQTRQHEWRLALAATGKKYHLLNRIERIMKTKKPIGNARHILLAIALLTASITGLAWLNPTIANGKIYFNKIKPSIITSLFSDTTHKKTVKAHKLVTTKKHVKTKRTYSDDENGAYKDAELDKLSADVNMYAEEVGKYYSSNDFKKMQADMELKGKALEDMYNKPEMKAMQEELVKRSADLAKNFGNDSEMQKMSEKMAQMGLKIEQYYSSPEFKQTNEQLEKKYGIPHDRKYDEYPRDENYQKYQAELDQHTPPEIREQTQLLKKMGEEMGSHYNTPEFRKRSDAMKLWGDSVAKAYNKPAMKEQQEQMTKLAEQMRVMQNSPEMKKAQELLRQAEARLRTYTNSPEFKKRMELYKNWDWQERSEKPEKLEMPEKPEKPEAPEPPAPAPLQPVDTTKNN